jgi:uncharacterized protein YehS (DUF1456 family)
MKQQITGEPCNAKSLLAFTFALMGKLDRGEIDTNTAVAQSKLISQANNIIKNELMRTALQIKMYEAHTGIEASEIKIRQVESKAFNESVFSDE